MTDENTSSPEPLTSYAQNFEDIVLWRALRHVQRGFQFETFRFDPRTKKLRTKRAP